MTDDKDYVPFTFTMDLNIINGDELYLASGYEPLFNFNENRLNPSILLWTNPYSSIPPSDGGDLLQMDMLKFQGNNKDARFIYQQYTGTHYCENPLAADVISESYVQQYIPVIKEVYPNPSTTGDFTLNLSDNSDQFHIRITNVIGQVVMDKDLSGFTHQLHIPAAGLYPIEVTNATGAKQHTKISIK